MSDFRGIWTEDSRICYNQKLICKGCPNQWICAKIPLQYKFAHTDGKPPMKWSVLQLVSELGLPKKKKQTPLGELIINDKV